MASDMESAAPPPAMAAQRSEWHSPVPYLFGGLGAMLVLIAFALVILACSFWKFGGNRVTRDVEDGGATAAKAVAEDKYVVIMAGQYKPTFLATPMSTIPSSLGSKNSLTNLPLEKDRDHDHDHDKRLQNVQIQMANI